MIRLDLSESDDARREFIRQQLGEPYRAVLGRLRHEIGHHYWPSLFERTPALGEIRALFGDERASCQEALQRHYDQGSPAGWPDDFVSLYATITRGRTGRDLRRRPPHPGWSRDGRPFGIAIGEPSASAGAAA